LVQGSDITGTNSASLKATDGVTIKSAEELYNEKTKSSNSSASIGVNVGVGITGVNASASANASASNSSSDTNSVNNVNSIINGGNNLSIVSGKDTTISGANISAKNVDLNIGRNLTIASVQDTMNSKSSSANVGGGVSISPANVGQSNVGTNANIGVSNGSSNSKVVNNQTSVTAEGGTLNVKVGDTTVINGGLIAAKDADGKDSGNLNLTTGKLVVTDLKDTKNSKDVSIGVSSDINNPFKKSEANNGNTPTIDGSYSSSTFAQDTKGTIGNGNIQIADATSSTPLEQINRDIANSQVVTKDKQSGFTAYYDKGAIDETKALLSGNKDNSVILQGVEEFKKNPLIIYDNASNEVKAILNKSIESQTEKLFATLAVQLGITSEQDIVEKINKAPEVIKAREEIDIKYKQDMSQVEQLRKDGKTNEANELEKKANEGHEKSNALINKAIDISSKSQYAILKNPKEALNTAIERPAAIVLDASGNPIQDDHTVIVTGTTGDKYTVGRAVVNTLKDGQELEQKYSEYWNVVETAVKTIATGGIKPILDYGLQKGIEAGIENAPPEVLKPIVENLSKANKYVGDNTASVILNKDVDKFKNAQEGTRPATDSSASAWGVEKVVGISAATIIGKAANKILNNSDKVVDVKKEVKALENIKKSNINAQDLSLKEPNSILYKQAEKISTAKNGQVTVPRDLNEQTLWNQILRNPELGEAKPNLNKDKRFSQDAGFIKMEATHNLPDGTSITIHYQYNSITKKAYDMKIVTPKRVPPQLQPRR